MNQNRNQNHVNRSDHVSDNDNDKNEHGGKAIAPASTGGALTSLAALSTALNAVDTTTVAGWSGMPMLQFKSRENNGTWTFGQKRTVPEDGSSWAVNPMTFKWGFICFGNDNKPRERLVPVSQPKPDVMELPNKDDSEWQEQWAVNLKCINGTDAGTEVVFKATTVGGIQAVAGLVEAVRDRLNGGQHDGKVAPIVTLEKSSYQHGQYGRVWTPVLTIVDWMPVGGPAPAAPAPVSPSPAPTSSAAEQPRRRRVA